MTQRIGKVALGLLFALLIGLAASIYLYFGRGATGSQEDKAQKIDTVSRTMSDGTFLSDDRKPDTNSLIVDHSKDTTYTYSWEDHNGGVVSFKLTVNTELYDYYRSLPRYYNPRDFYHYVDDSYAQLYAKQIVDALKKMDWEYGYSNYDTILHAIEFVQNLNYIDDVDGNGKETEYPKYPIETLCDQGGDCEDTAILLAALMKEFGYGCIFIKFDDHIGLGVYGDESLEGAYYELDGKRYYYVETTKPNWDIGEFPDDLSSTATLIKIP